MKSRILLILIVLVFSRPLLAQQQKDVKASTAEGSLEEYLAEARATASAPSSGDSLFSTSATNLFLFKDVKARRVNDIITIQIVENATAQNSSNTATQKKGDASIGFPNMFGLENTSALNLAKLLGAASNLSFSGSGSTSRSGALQAWLTARVIEVLPNGDLVIEGAKDVTINKERQSLTVRGVVRTRDVTPGNIVLSTVVSHMEVKFDGKGIVTNANKPGFLYNVFSKIMPF
jgi:flagellar L-ring protein precursor FlgH